MALHHLLCDGIPPGLHLFPLYFPRILAEVAPNLGEPFPEKDLIRIWTIYPFSTSLWICWWFYYYYDIIIYMVLKFWPLVGFSYL